MTNLNFVKFAPRPEEEIVTRRWQLCLMAAFSATVGVTALHAQAAIPPPMGWNSWNHFGTNVTEVDVRAAADALVSSGMRDAGYVYVNIDDTWEGKRDSQGIIRANE